MGKKVETAKGKGIKTPTYPRCGEHKKYKGLRRPSIDCFVCWDIYELRMGLTSEEKVERGK